MRITTACVAAAGLVVLAGTVQGQQTFTAVRVAQGLTRPLFVTAPPGDRNRLFIVEQRGSGGVASQASIRILNLATNTIEATPFLTIGNMPTNTQTNSEQGLLGLAFDPNYATNGFFYINYTSAATTNGTTIIARYTVSANPNIADPNSATTLLTLVQPFVNHNGGWLAFGPDGHLYAALGDGGSGGDPGNRAQNTGVLFGKILRIIPSGDAFPADPNRNYTYPSDNPFALAGGTPEVWAYGLRNPWRPSFDRQTGDLFIADVGQESWEEVSFQPAIGAPPYTAVNYGWRCYEGTHTFNTTGCPPQASLTFPVHEYSSQTGSGNCSVTGGYVYRGCSVTSARGLYFFSDYCSGRMWTFRLVGGVVTELTDRTAQLTPVGGPAPALVASFGEDAMGELYWMGNGNLFKLVPSCYVNCDSSTEPPVLNVQDFTCFLQRYASNDCFANCDGSTVPPTLNVQDFTCFLQRYATGCP
jgi:glucose/arabinose dehydrogenase